MSCFTEKRLVQFVKNYDVSTKMQKNYLLLYDSKYSV